MRLPASPKQIGSIPTMPEDPQFIPIYSASGNLVPSLLMTAADVEAHSIYFQRICRTRRAQAISRAYLRDSLFTLSNRPSSRTGISYLEPLSTGHVWAMRTSQGTRVVA